MNIIKKKILLCPGGFYEFTVTAPQPLSIHAFDGEITLQPGDKLQMIIQAPPHPHHRAALMPVPDVERKTA